MEAPIKRYFKLAAVLASVVIAGALAEGALRLLGYHPRQMNLMQYSREVGGDAPGRSRAAKIGPPSEQP